MLGYFTLFLNYLFYIAIFSGYVWKRSFRVMGEYLSQLCGLSKPGCYFPSNADRPWLLVKPLEKKSLLSVTGFFSPKFIELKLYNGIVSGLKFLASRYSITIDQNFKIKTVTSVDQLNIFYQGSLKFMSSEFPFSINVELSNIKIFREFNVTPYCSKSIVNNVCIDDIKLEMDICYCILHNASNNFGISGVLKIVSFLIKCLLEFIIMSKLKLEFSSSDVFNIYPDFTLKNPVMNYLKITKDIGYRFYPAKSFISVLNIALVEIDRKFLTQNFSGILFNNNKYIEDACEVDFEDESKVQVKEVRWVQVEDGYWVEAEDERQVQVEDHFHQTSDNNDE